MPSCAVGLIVLHVRDGCLIMLGLWQGKYEKKSQFSGLVPFPAWFDRHLALYQFAAQVCITCSNFE